MPHILKNENLVIRIDHPLEGYRFSRFDWTGKISSVKFHDIDISTNEQMTFPGENDFGKGFCNEFGIDGALGFGEAPVGGWFHKIGVGLLKKEGSVYQFHRRYAIDPASFDMEAAPGRVVIRCTSRPHNGYAYLLTKEISLVQSGFVIRYLLENTGEKEIRTSEYNHNFISIGHESMGPGYRLRFPFQLDNSRFSEIVNPEQKVEVGNDTFTFTGTPAEQFFFGDLSGHETVEAQWELRNTKYRLAIRESGSFKTDRINLWGWGHVISPELFCQLQVKPGQSAGWSRRYDVYEIPEIDYR
jgi:hypothetical protein